MQTVLLVLFFVALGVAVVMVAMRSGAKGPLLDPNRKGSRRALAWMLALSVLAFAIAIPIAVGIDKGDAEATAGPIQLNEQEQRGRQLFNENCSQCHALEASSAVQQVGPDLDALRPPKELVLDAIREGRARGQGQMPADLVTGPEAEAVAAYVAKVAGRR